MARFNEAINEWHTAVKECIDNPLDKELVKKRDNLLKELHEIYYSKEAERQEKYEI